MGLFSSGANIYKGAVETGIDVRKKVIGGDLKGAGTDATFGIFTAPSGPEGIAPPPPAPSPVDPVGVEEQAATGRAREEERRRARVSQGLESTILTSPLGLTGQANVRRKTLLGQ